MKSRNNSALRIGIILLIVLLGVGLFVYMKKDRPDKKIGGATYDRVSYDIMGTASSPTTTNSVYGGNIRTLVSTGLENLHLDIKYTPASQDSVLYILVEGSNDGGTTFFPMTTKTNGTTDIKLYQEGVTSTAGIPITFPGDSTSVSGTAYLAGVDFDMVADHVRVSAKESTTSTKGTLYMRATLTSKK